MTASQARRAGGALGVLVGAVCLDVLPPLGILEVGASIGVLLTPRRQVSLLAAIPAALIVWSAALVMATVSGPANPIMWPVAIAATFAVLLLIRGGVGSAERTEGT